MMRSCGVRRLLLLRIPIQHSGHTMGVNTQQQRTRISATASNATAAAISMTMARRQFCSATPTLHSSAARSSPLSPPSHSSPAFTPHYQSGNSSSTAATSDDDGSIDLFAMMGGDGEGGGDMLGGGGGAPSSKKEEIAAATTPSSATASGGMRSADADDAAAAIDIDSLFFASAAADILTGGTAQNEEKVAAKGPSQSKKKKALLKRRNMPSARHQQSNAVAADATGGGRAAPPEGGSDVDIGDQYHAMADDKKAERAKQIRKLKRQLQFLAAKESSMKRTLRQEEKKDQRRRMAAAMDARKPFSENGGGKSKASSSSSSRQAEYLKAEFERLRNQRPNYHTIPDDLSEMLPANEALETAMAYSIISHKDARAHLDFTHKLLKSHLLSLAAPVGWWDPYDVKPQAFALDQYAALPVFTNVSYLQHFCHKYGFAVRDPSGTLWADGGNVKQEPPKLSPPNPWAPGGGERDNRADAEAAVNGSGAGKGKKGATDGGATDGFFSSSVSSSLPTTIDPEDFIASAATLLGVDKTRKIGSGAAAAAAGAKAAGGGGGSNASSPDDGALVPTEVEGVIKPSGGVRADGVASSPLVVDRVTARKFEQSIVDGNASVDADAFMDMLSGDGDDGAAVTAAPAAAAEKEEASASAAAEQQFPSSSSATAAGAATATASSSGNANVVDDDGDIDMFNLDGGADDDAADTAAPSSSAAARRAAAKAKRREERRRAAEEAFAKERAFKAAMAEREKEAAAHKEKLWQALEATPKALTTATVVTPLVTYGPFIRPYFVGYYADFRTLLHNASIVPKMVDIIVNPGSPMETIISRNAAKETLTNEALLRSAYNRVEYQLRAEFHNFFLAYCKKGEIQSARSYCMAQPTPDGVAAEDTLFDIAIVVDCDDFDKLTKRLRRAKQKGILKGHSSLHVVPLFDAPDFMVEGSTIFFECDPEDVRPEYTPVDFYAPTADEAAAAAAAGGEGGASTGTGTGSTNSAASSSSSSSSSVGSSVSSTANTVAPLKPLANGAFENSNIAVKPIDPTAQQILQMMKKATSGPSHSHAPRKVGKFAQVGSHATISTRYEADSMYADPTNQSTEAGAIASQRFRLGVGIEQM